MARITYIPNRVIDTDGIADGASIYVYTTGTTTPVSIYSDADFTTPVTNPYVVAAGAAVPPLYHNEETDVRVRVVSNTGAVISDEDPYDSYITQAALTNYAESVASRSVYGTKAFATDRLRAFDMAEEISNPATSPIWGFAKYAGVSGGYGLTEDITYDPDGDGTSVATTVPFVRYITNDSEDPNVEGSLPWCIAEVEANDGGYILAHPRGRLEVTLNSTLYLPNNCTLAAPGRNLLIKMPLNGGGIRFFGPSGSAEYGRNIILWGINVLVEGDGDDNRYDQKPGEIDAFNAIPSNGSNKIAMYECTVSGATDAFLDIAGGSTPATDSYYSILRCSIRNTDKTMAVGVGTGSLADTPKLWVTVGECHFEGCSQRKPMASSLSYIHWHSNVDDSVPHYRDYTEGNSIGTVYGGNCRYGGRLRYESNIVRFGTTTAGFTSPDNSVTTFSGVTNTSGNEGAALLIDNHFDDGIVETSSFNTSYVTDLPVGYEYPTRDVLTDTDIVADEIIDAAGAGRTNSPDGLYATVSEEEGDALGLRVNGEQIRYRNRQFLIRVGEENDFLKNTVADALNLSRGGTLTVASGAITLTDDRMFAVAGEGGVADDLTTINLTTDDRYEPITGGFIFIRPASNSTPITLKSGGNIEVTRPIILDDTSKWTMLFYNGATWDVIVKPKTSNTYTPSLTATLNCSALVLINARWEMEDNRVRVRIKYNGTATAAGLTRVTVSLPKAAPNLTADEVWGVVAMTNGYGTMYGDPATDSVIMTFTATGAGNFGISTIFEYEIN